MPPHIIDLHGAENVRDLGGYPTADGVTRHGAVYRGDGLDRLSLEDQRHLLELGIAATLDLRGADEAQEKPSRLPAGIEYRHLPMTPEEARATSMLDRIFAGELTEFTDPMMANGYLRMMEHYGDAIRSVATAVGAGERVLFHCAAGKDRTGVVAMVLLGIAGVAREHLVDDYHLTESLRQRGAEDLRRQFAEAGVDAAPFETLGGAPRRVMELTLDGVEERWGSLIGYAQTIGLDDELQTAVRLRLTEPR